MAQLDPTFFYVAKLAVALIFFISAIQKLRDIEAFELTVDLYDLIPDSLVKGFSRILPVAELVTAGLLVTNLQEGLSGLSLAILIMTVTTLAVVVNLTRGNIDMSCGCGGLEDESSLSWSLVGRNIVILGVLAVCLVSNNLRALTALDFVTIIAGSIGIYLLYALNSQLIANKPRLSKLRDSL
jgi:hypothetical protein